jgi:hypothetical protein
MSCSLRLPTVAESSKLPLTSIIPRKVPESPNPPITNAPFQLPETPFNDDLERAAELIGDGMTANQLRYEIKTYATRNAISHLGIKKLINESRWSAFAFQTQRDLKYLHHAFREAVEPEPEHQTRLRAAIKNLQRKYLLTVYWEDDSTVGFTLTERANKLTAARRRRT